MKPWLTMWLGCLLLLAAGNDLAAIDFEQEIAPILEQNCLRCHSGTQPKGDIDLSARENFSVGSLIVEPGEPQRSRLLEVISGSKPQMPPGGEPLAQSEIEKLRDWIAAGAPWPESTDIEFDPLDWWSLRPLEDPLLPPIAAEDSQRVKTPIDRFILSKLSEKGLEPSAEADRRTLIRRLFYDLTGLPPSPEEVRDFVHDTNPQAYERLVERLLASPRYGEHWARHWLDVVRYADTHGYDKDKPRPHAWPYRDYVIRSLNEDKPYSRFVREQLAGDHFYPGTADGIVGLGFIAAGPFDFVGHIEVANGTQEKDRVRNIDRDDMVSAAMNTFVSLTAQCARCHDHKFDPISQEDYYSLQAVFAAVDRADRTYDADPEVARRRELLTRRQHDLAAEKQLLEQAVVQAAGPDLLQLDKEVAELSQKLATANRPEYGFHSAIVPSPDQAKWVQLDLGRAVSIQQIVLVPAYDDYAGIGAGFGFPVRFKVEISDDPEFQRDVRLLVGRTSSDVPNPGITPQTIEGNNLAARYVRLTATRLSLRRNDYILALAELKVLTAEGRNAAREANVTSLDSIEAPPRWRRANLVDGIYPGSADNASNRLTILRNKRQELLAGVDEKLRVQLSDATVALSEVERSLSRLPARQKVYAAATEFTKQGNFVPTGGQPRSIFVLNRGSEQDPAQEVGPGTVGCIPELPARFQLESGHDESQRRAALAQWIVDPRNSLTWRSMANRVWYYHFGRGIVETPNDFGRMGALPTHPQLLDWLAAQLRETQSLKHLHRQIVNSATYRQRSTDIADNSRLDAANRYLWRMNRRRLSAEAIRDGVLATSGKIRLEMYGPGFQSFEFENDHSPRYLYVRHDPDDPAGHRRAIYRFVVRSVPDPWMTTLDCADPSLIVARRNETLTSLQALALLNNPFVVRMAEHFAERVRSRTDDPGEQVTAAYQFAYQRDPTSEEREALVPLVSKHGLANVCRLILNTNEFLFID